METKADNIIKRIDELKMPETITKEKDMDKLLLQIQELVVEFNELSDETKRAIKNTDRLMEVASFFQDFEKVEAFRKKYAQPPKKKPPVQASQTPVKVTRKAIVEEELEPEVEEAPIVAKPFINEQLDNVKKIQADWKRVLTDDEKEAQYALYREKLELVRQDVVALIAEIRVSQKKINTNEETQSSLYYYNDDVDSMVLDGEDSEPMWGLDLPKDQKVTPLSKLKQESVKKERLHQHKREVIQKTYERNSDDYYNTVQPEDEQVFKKKKMEKVVVIKGLIVIGFIAACIIGTLYAIITL